jgi:hypothetical protein
LSLSAASSRSPLARSPSSAKKFEARHTKRRDAFGLADRQCVVERIARMLPSRTEVTERHLRVDECEAHHDTQFRSLHRRRQAPDLLGHFDHLRRAVARRVQAAQVVERAPLHADHAGAFAMLGGETQCVFRRIELAKLEQKHAAARMAARDADRIAGRLRQSERRVRMGERGPGLPHQMLRHRQRVEQARAHVALQDRQGKRGVGHLYRLVHAAEFAQRIDTRLHRDSPLRVAGLVTRRVGQ